MRTLGRRETPRCPECGGEMEKFAYGGEERDHDTGKWRASRQESWRCKTAIVRYERATNEAMARVRDEFVAHCRPVSYERAPKGETAQEALAL